MRLQINGRGRLVAVANVVGGRCTIRIDDRNLEFWAEVNLSVEQLRELLGGTEDELDWEENHR